MITRFHTSEAILRTDNDWTHAQGEEEIGRKDLTSVTPLRERMKSETIDLEDKSETFM